MYHHWHNRTVLAAVAAIVMLTAASHAAENKLIGNGIFKGESGHQASGVVSVWDTDQGRVVVLGKDFAFDGAPDPKLGFGKGSYVPSSKFSELRSNSGEQTYSLPASIDPGNFNQVWIWCEQYNVPLGVAEIK